MRTTRTLLIGAFIALLMACDGSTERRPVVLIGIDGAEWRVIDEMIADGELPHLARIREQGAWGHLINPGPLVSPIVWSTFVTGHFGRRHGILDHVFPFADAGAKRPVSSELRQEPALWNVATHYGQRSAVVGYFVTHPVEEIDGVMISPLAPRRIQGSVWPPDTIDYSAPQLRQLRNTEVKQKIWSQFFGWAFSREQASDPNSPYYEAARTVVERNLTLRIIEDEFLHRTAMQLADEPFDLFIAYFRLPDFMSHSLWAFYDDSDFDPPPEESEKQLFGQAVQASYRFVDRAIGELLQQWDGEANVVIVSDHGFGTLRNRRMDRRRFQNLTGDHRPNGVLMAIGPDIEPGEIRGVTTMEVAPTLAVLAGLPVSDELPGSVATHLLSESFLDRFPLTTVASYDAVEILGRAATSDRDAQQQDMSALRGLGYIGEGVDLDESAASGDYDFWSAGAWAVSQNLHAEVVYALLHGDLDAAEEIMSQVRERRPELVDAVIRISRGKFRGLRRRLGPEHFDPQPFEQFFDRHPIEAGQQEPESD